MSHMSEAEMEEQRDKIIDQLEMLNEKMEKQNSIKHIFFTGIIYGIGWFLGSVVIATIAFGVLSPWVSKIGWVHDNFQKGSVVK